MPNMTIGYTEALRLINDGVLTHNQVHAAGGGRWQVDPEAEERVLIYRNNSAGQRAADLVEEITRMVLDDVPTAPTIRFNSSPQESQERQSYNTWTTREEVPMFTWSSVSADSYDDSDSDYEDREEDDEPCDSDNEDWAYSSDSINRRRELSEEDMPAFELPRWANAPERERVVELYFKHMEYRLNWIFLRQEREGFTRRQVQPFSRQDFLDKVAKSTRPHPLNTEASMFYDWNFGATDFILRLENFEIDGIDCMRCHFIYKPNMLEIGYQDRYWNGECYQEINIEWAQMA
jgi:hypothetical protein